MTRILLALLLLSTTGAFAGRSDSLLRVLHALPEDTSRLPVLRQLVNTNLHQRPDSALPYAEVFLALADRGGTPRQQAVARSQLGLVHLLRGRHAEALPLFLDALQRFGSLDEPRSVAMLLGNVATVYQKEGRPREAMPLLLRAQRLFQQEGDIFWAAGISEELANTYASMGMLDSADHWFDRTVRIMERVGGGRHVVETRSAQAELWEGGGSDERAVRLYTDALAAAEELGEQELVARVLRDRGRLLVVSGATEAGARDLYRALAIVQRGGFDAMRLEVHEALSDLHRRAGQADSAVWHLQRYVAWKDSLFTRENSARIADLQARYDLVRKDADLEHQQLLLARRRTQLTVALSVAGLLVLVVIALWRARAQRRRHLDEVREQHARVKETLQEKELLLRELHHRVKNNLQTVSSLLRLQSRADMDPAARTAIEEANARVKSMVLVHQDLYREGQLTAVDMQAYLPKLGTALLRGHGLEQRVRLSWTIDPLRLDVDSAVPIGLIVNELITNALKHAFPGEGAGEVGVELHDRGEILQLTVRDDGVGLEPVPAGARSGEHGMGLVATFAGSLDAQWEVDGSAGTVVTLRMRNFVRA